MGREASKKSCCRHHPRLQRYVLQPLLLVVMVAVVVVPTTLVFLRHKAELAASKSRISCLAVDVSESECTSSGCLWSPIEGGAPSCYFPPADTHGYRVLDRTYTDPGIWTLQLGLLDTSAKVVPELKQELVLELTQYGDAMFRVRKACMQIRVPGEERFEPPVPLQLPVPQAPDQELYDVAFSADDVIGQVFTLVVTRKDSGTVIFDSGLGGLTYASQFLQVATSLPSSDVYGLGEHAHASFRHSFASPIVYPIFARAQPPYPGSTTNLYGAHPVYYVIEDDTHAHAVLWLNSNAMGDLFYSINTMGDLIYSKNIMGDMFSSRNIMGDLLHSENIMEAELIPKPGLALRAIGGVMDLFFLLGPAPNSVVQQYAQLVGLPAMPPYWALGHHIGRLGYNNTEEIRDVVSRTRRNGIPQDVQHGDIDIMHHNLDFTIDNDNFSQLPEFVKKIKDEGVKFMTVLDPAINAELGPDYEVHVRGVAGNVYVTWGGDVELPDGGNNYGAGDLLLGHARPDNRSAFADFLRPATQTWWGDEILRFRDALQFDGLLIVS
ncbi:hypothetical protein HAZT_HAZT009475 [Hyalella azteca]|uniref:Maltase n=1 Tax=Hyalella azteca TaxID=294128 RepID=A0A6A0H334_HYAAZ|nr:hypothetical protein HAZT_HAZT009475 [Hyalella azteca]